MIWLAGSLWGCARSPGLVTPGSRPQRWEVSVAVGSGARSLSAHYTLASEPAGDDVWVVWTEHSRGWWEDDLGSYAYDSAAPADTDPWPLTLQHLVASVPARLQLDPVGVPIAVLEADAWQAEARRRFAASALPSAALPIGEPLLDPAGLLADLARTFPGAPPDGVWQRAEEIAGVWGVRREDCAHTLVGHGSTWDCAGSVTSPPDADARMHEVHTTTRLEVDAHGLQLHTSRYTGTLIAAGPSGEVRDRPVAGLRRTVRR